MKIHCIRLRPNEDLKKALFGYVTNSQIKAAAIVTCVGSLTEVNLRMAGQTSVTHLIGKHEIISLVGTLSLAGMHLHIGISDENGKVTGGHLMDGSLVNTTAEIVLAELTSFEFKRSKDPLTGYNELEIHQTD